MSIAQRREGYDAYGRLETHTSGGRTIAYGYDPARGLRTQTAFPSGVTSTTAYDPAGRISSVLSAKNGQVLAGRTYPVIDKANRRKTIGEPDGTCGPTMTTPVAKLNPPPSHADR